MAATFAGTGVFSHLEVCYRSTGLSEMCRYGTDCIGSLRAHRRRRSASQTFTTAALSSAVLIHTTRTRAARLKMKEKASRTVDQSGFGERQVPLSSARRPLNDLDTSPKIKRREETAHAADHSQPGPEKRSFESGSATQAESKMKFAFRKILGFVKCTV